MAPITVNESREFLSYEILEEAYGSDMVDFDAWLFCFDKTAMFLSDRTDYLKQYYQQLEVWAQKHRARKDR